ncbi:hypothetical protein BD626DRAFT_495386, partial [Schizophyllum amplum]
MYTMQLATPYVVRPVHNDLLEHTSAIFPRQNPLPQPIEGSTFAATRQRQHALHWRLLAGTTLPALALHKRLERAEVAAGHEDANAGSQLDGVGDEDHRSAQGESWGRAGDGRRRRRWHRQSSPGGWQVCINKQISERLGRGEAHADEELRLPY